MRLMAAFAVLAALAGCEHYPMTELEADEREMRRRPAEVERQPAPRVAAPVEHGMPKEVAAEIHRRAQAAVPVAPIEPAWRDPTDPEMEELKYAAERHLKDGGSAKYLSVKVEVSDTPDALTMCGLLNAKNSYGAYVGYRSFLYTSGSGSTASFLVEDGRSIRSVIEAFCRGAR